MHLTRRELIRRLGVLLAGTGMTGGAVPVAIARVTGGVDPFAGAGAGAGRGPSSPLRKIPLIHTTDLYDPPQDPDDQIDLATVFALEEYDLRGVVLDITEKFLHPKPGGWDIARKPGFESVARMARMTGKAMPVAQGPHRPLSDPRDTCGDAPDEEQAGIRMILRLLEDSREPVLISVTGSPRTVTAAYNRDPTLLREKTRAVLLNAGSTGGTKGEWNVGLDLQAYIGLWRSDLPIRWYPPGTESGAFNPSDERGTYYRAPQAELFRDLPPALGRYIADALAIPPPEGVPRAKEEDGDGPRWQAILGQTRNLWSTASLVMGAGRVLADTEDGWRFLSAEDLGSGAVWPWRLDPIRASVDEEGRVAWSVTDAHTRRWIFGRRPGREFGHAMTEALNALLRGMKGPEL
jgi:hypothetical protein